MNLPARIALASVLILPAVPARANSLHRMDMLTDGHSDRVTFEFDQRAEYKLSSPNVNLLEIAFKDVDLAPEFAPPDPPAGLKVIDRMSSRKDEKGKLVVTIHLLREAEPTGVTLNATPWKYAMDLSPKLPNGKQANPEYIPGDLPIRTKYADTDPALTEPTHGVHMTRLSFMLMMLLSFAAGMITIIASVYGLQHFRRRLRAVPHKSEMSSSPQSALSLELKCDLARLKRTVNRESAELSDHALSLMADREKLILKLMQQGQTLDAIALALDMSPDQVRSILDRHP